MSDLSPSEAVFEAIRDGFTSFVESEFKARYQDKWQEVIETERSREKRRHPLPKDADGNFVWSPKELLEFVISRNPWEVVFENSFRKNEQVPVIVRGFLRQFINFGHLWAHPRRPCTPEETTFLFYLSERLLRAAGATRQADAVRALFRATSKYFSEKYLQRDCARRLIDFYGNETAVSVVINGQQFKLPLVKTIEPVGQGYCEEQDLFFTMETDAEFRPDETMHLFTETIAREAECLGHWNGNVVRLDAIERRDVGTILHLRCAKYFDALGTNFAMDQCPQGGSLTLRDRVHGNSRAFHEFRGDRLVNHIGVVCMIETVDGMMIIQDRSDDVAIRPMTMSSSVSGVVDYCDVRNVCSRGLARVSDIATSVVREGEEELGIEIAELFFLGSFREMLRGGKPEMYFFGRAKQSLLQVQSCHKTAISRNESVAILGIQFCSAMSDIDRRIQSALGLIENKANMTLTAGLLLSAEHVRDRLK